MTHVGARAVPEAEANRSLAPAKRSPWHYRAAGRLFKQDNTSDLSAFIFRPFKIQESEVRSAANVVYANSRFSRCLHGVPGSLTLLEV